MAASEQSLQTNGSQPGRYGQVFDRGYQHYDGQRLGRKHAFGALVRYSIRRSLGVKKSWSAKIMPILIYVSIAMVIVIPLGLEAFMPSADVLAYWDFALFIFGIVGLFVASIAPEMLCGDRREHVLPLYFSRAITRLDYLLAKLVATAILTLTVSLAPSAIYWLGRQLLDDSPVQAIRHNADDLGRLIVVGVLIALYLGSIGLAIASFTGRKAIAVAITFVGFGISTSLVNALAGAINSDLTRYFIFGSPAQSIDTVSNQLFNQPVPDFEFGDPLSLAVMIGGMLVTTAICCGIMYWRYVPNE
jgi:ABC-2 type transport system permease protein